PRELRLEDGHRRHAQVVNRGLRASLARRDRDGRENPGAGGSQVEGAGERVRGRVSENGYVGRTLLSAAFAVAVLLFRKRKSRSGRVGLARRWRKRGIPRPGAPSLRVLCARVGFHGRVPLGIFGLMKFLRTRAGGADYHTRLYFGGVLRSSPCPDSSQTQCDGHYCAAPGICAKVQWGKR